MNLNLPRWVFSSMAKKFSEVAATIPLNYFVQGVDEPESRDFQVDSALFRMTGPVAYQSAGDEEQYQIELMILLTDIIQLTNDEAYSIYKWAGVFQAAMLDVLPVYKYGTGPEDDDSLIGCLQPDPKLKNNVRIVDYGQIDKDLRIRQCSINGRFILD